MPPALNPARSTSGWIESGYLLASKGQFRWVRSGSVAIPTGHPSTHESRYNMKPGIDSDRQLATTNEWSLASDGIQWILRRCRRKDGQTSWRPVSFVRSTRAILARCMREKGVPPEDAERLLSGLPSTFDEWRQNRPRSRSEPFTASPPTVDAPQAKLVPDQVFHEEETI